MITIKTEYPFTLPRGYVDAEGNVHRQGVMRMATARDEIEPLRDPKVAGPEDPLLTVMVLARVITRLGGLEQVTPRDVEGLFAVDLAYLQDFYGVINFGSDADIALLLAQDAEEDLHLDDGEGDADPELELLAGGRRGRAAIEEVPSIDR